VLARARKQLGAAIDSAGPTTYVPWQDCALPTDDFLVVRLMEIVVHADDLACSVDVAAPAFSPEVLEPRSPSSQRWPRDVEAKTRSCATLSRHERRSAGSISAF